MQTLPHWLVPVWNYGAALTGLVDWDAWAAIATAGATAAALWISGREERRAVATAKANDIRLLKAMLIVMENGYNATKKVQQDLRLPAYRVTGPALAKAAIADEKLSEVTNCLEGFSAAAMPSTTSVDLLMAARVSWRGIIAALQHISRQKVSAAEKLYPDMADPEWLSQVTDGPWDHANKVIEALADEILRRGGAVEFIEDISVQNRLAAAKGRATAS